MRTIIAGSRGIVDPRIVALAVDRCGWTPSVVLSGKAKGVDTLGENWANANGIPVDPYPADWNNLEAPGAVIKTTRGGKRYNAVAGHKRNSQMADNAQCLISIWDGKSTGTRHMIQDARSKGLRVFIFDPVKKKGRTACPCCSKGFLFVRKRDTPAELLFCDECSSTWIGGKRPDAFI